jgi:hypothetical protein
VSFQAYLDNIQKKTGKTPTDFYTLASRQGLINPALTASRLVAWLKDEFGLGHGHAMAIWAVFKSNGWAAGKGSTTSKRRTTSKGSATRPATPRGRAK